MILKTYTGCNVQRTGKNLLGGVDFAESFRGCVGFALDTTAKTFNYGRSKTPVMDGIKYKPNTQYTIIWTCSAVSRNNSFIVKYTDGTTEQIVIVENSTKSTLVFSTKSGKTVDRFALSYNQWGIVTVSYDESGIFEGVLTADDFAPYTGTTYSIDWTDEAGTVYGGELDVTTGVLTAVPYYGSYNGETLVGPWVSSMDKYVAGTTPTIGAQVVDMGGTGTNIQLSATDVELLEGNNTIWNDVGDMTLEYLADGPAEDIDALQILLGNRYVNNGEEDEATDREALDILLGGNTR